MDLNGVPFFALMRERMSWLDRRQQVIATNVANADTPGYVARDLRPFSEVLGRHGGAGAMAGSSSGGAVSMAVTNAAHMTAGGGTPASPYRAQSSGDTETTLNGNRVVLEDEMVRMGEARMNYEAAVSFYQRGLGLLRTAARAPGRG